MYNSFLYKAKQTVYKWWCVIYKPVYKLTHHGYWPAEKEPYYVPPEQKGTPAPMPIAPQIEPDNISLDLEDTKETVIATEVTPDNTQKDVTTMDKVQNKSAISDDDSAKRAQEIMDRLNREAAADEAKKQAEIDAARRKAEEDARVASILKSNQHDISQYISEGIASRKDPESETVVEEAPQADDDVLKRAQEIMDRLNQEAAEDEAKKQAEIEAAKEYARQNNL